VKKAFLCAALAAIALAAAGRPYAQCEACTNDYNNCIRGPSTGRQLCQPCGGSPPQCPGQGTASCNTSTHN
jgi:hypothetical protein